MIAEATAVGMDTLIPLGSVATLAVVVFAAGRVLASLRHRLDDVEKSQKESDKWLKDKFSPWRKKVDRTLDRVAWEAEQADGKPSRRRWPTTTTEET